MRLGRGERGVARGVVLLLGIGLASVGHAQEISLPDAVRQTLSANLDLAAQRQQLAADREEIGLARSALLPQVGVGARYQILDDDRSDSARGNNDVRSLLFAAGLSQVIYDEESWAGFSIQKHVYRGQVQQLEAFRLGVIQDAGLAFLELDRSQRVLEIQERNRELTTQNLETSQARIAAGWSSEREVLRWETQLAGNDFDVRAAQVSVLQNRFALNRVRNLAPEEPVSAARPTLEEYGFIYASDAVAKAVVTPEQDRRTRDFLVRLGLRRSPDLAALDASIEATERQLTAKRRAFWIPSLTVNAGIDHQTTRGDSDFNQTEWIAKGLLTFPVVQGGAKIAGFKQARSALAGFRTQRRATAITLEESIRSALAEASGAFESVGFARRGQAAAQRNFELVDSSYTLGVASILDLLDAQSQLLTAELALANATYDFLEALLAAERELSYYAFLEAPTEVDELVRQLEQELGIRP
jgi:outer membrane protein